MANIFTYSVAMQKLNLPAENLSKYHPVFGSLMVNRVPTS